MRVLPFIAGACLLNAAACGPPAPPDGPPAPSAAPLPTHQPPNRSALPTPGPTPEWNLETVSHWSLPNGLTVWHLRQDHTPLVSLRLVFPSGSATDPPAKAGLSGLTADMLDEGAGTLSALELGLALERLGSDYSVSSERDSVRLAMNMLADQVKPSLRLLADIILRPKLPAAEFDRRKKFWIAQAMAREAHPNAVRSLITTRVLFGDGYGGPPALGTQSSLADITLKEVKAHYQAAIRPQGAVLIAVGDVGRAELRSTLDELFGSWQGAPSSKPAAVAAAPLPARAIYLADFPGSTQSSVSLARRIEGAESAELFSAKVFNWSLGGAFSSRLNLNLREDKGYTYGARSQLWRWKKVGAFVLAAQVKSETTRPTIDEMRHELTALAGPKPLSAEEHRQAIDGLLRGFPGRFEQLDGLAGKLAAQASLGRDANWLGAWPARIAAVTLEQAIASGRSHATADSFAIIVAGDAAAISASLDGLGLPRYRCDREGVCRPEG